MRLGETLLDETMEIFAGPSPPVLFYCRIEARGVFAKAEIVSLLLTSIVCRSMLHFFPRLTSAPSIKAGAVGGALNGPAPSNWH